MLSKLKNEREISLLFKYNTKKCTFHFKSNHLDYPINNSSIKNMEKMIALAFQNENAVFYRMTFRNAFKLIDKQNKKYFNKLSKIKS